MSHILYGKAFRNEFSYNLIHWEYKNHDDNDKIINKASILMMDWLVILWKLTSNCFEMNSAKHLIYRQKFDIEGIIADQGLKDKVLSRKDLTEWWFFEQIVENQADCKQSYMHYFYIILISCIT